MTRPSRRLLAPLLLPVLLALPGCGGGGEPAPSTSGAVTAVGPPGGQTATVVGNAQLEFAPEAVRAAVGTLALRMDIAGGVPHNLVFDDATVGPPIPVTTSGSGTSTYTFSAPGTYRFECTLHPGMIGQVVVG